MEPVRRDNNPDADAGITHAQIAKIFACARELGLDRELLYLMVPRGSISALSHQEASELIERLVELGARRVAPASSRETRPFDPNAATQEQRNFIHFLFGRLGWIGSPARVRGFLRKFASVDTVEAIEDRRRASAIIEALKAMYRRQNASRTMKPQKGTRS
jgi:hypothetical protein